MKKTKISKVISVLLAVLMLCSTSIVAFAKDAQTGTITITNVTQGEKYSVYKLLDVTYSESSDGAVNYAYTVNSDFDAFFGGLGLTGYTAGDKITSAESKVAYDYILTQSTPEKISAFATEVAKYADTGSIAAAKETTAVNEKNIVFTDVESGYYVMVPESADTNVLTSALFSIGTVTDAVELTNKSVYPALTKRIIEDNTAKSKVDAAFGDKVTYQLASSVPNTDGYSSYTFDMIDTLDEDLTFNNDVTVAVGDKILVEDTDFTVTQAGNEVTISFVDFVQYNTAEFEGKDIIVTYSATVGNTADLGSVGNANTAVLVYSNDPRDISSTERTKITTETTSTVYVTGFEFNKVNGRGSALAEAVFDIAGLPAGAVVTAGSVNGTQAVTDATGVVSVAGIKEGTYTITEIDAPNGYIKLDAPVVLTITFDETTGTFSVDDIDDSHVDQLVLDNANGGKATFNLINETMSILPDTGATTTIICVGAGLVCLAIAGFVAIAGKKKKESSAE